jgi:hypothetical protein
MWKFIAPNGIVFVLHKNIIILLSPLSQQKSSSSSLTKRKVKSYVEKSDEIIPSLESATLILNGVFISTF